MVNSRSLVQRMLAAALAFSVASGGFVYAASDTKQTLTRSDAMRAPGDSARINSLFSQLRDTDSAESAQSIANQIWRIWLRSGSDTVDLLISRAQVLTSERQFDDAIELLDAVVEIAPRYAEGWNKRATVYFLKGDYRQSIIDVRQVLALEPRHFGALSGLGTMMREIGDAASALTAYRAALKVYPALPGAKRAAEELTEEVEGREI